MEQLVLNVPDDERPIYVRIAEALREAICSGQLKVGEKMPSTRNLASRFGVHRHTVIAAMNRLVEEGWLDSGERRVHRVAKTLPIEFFTASTLGDTKELGKQFAWRLVRDPPQIFKSFGRKEKYDYRLDGSLPDLRLFPYKEFHSCLAESLWLNPQAHTGYGDSAGYAFFVEQVDRYLRRVRSVKHRPILVTHGVQEAIFLVAQLLLDKGDKVAVERLGYPPAAAAMKASGAELVPVEIDGQGMCPDSLEETLELNKIRLIYLTPHHQFPTTVTLPLTRRDRIYELASRFGVPIFEDDYDHEYHFEPQPVAPMASNDPEGLVIYAGTFSKVMFPAVRLGFLSVPERIYDPLLRMKPIVSNQNSVLVQDAVARWIEMGGFERHMRRMRLVYKERRDAMGDQLTKVQAQGLPISWEIPDGGMALWFNCGVDSDRVAAEAAVRGVRVYPESSYQLEWSPTSEGRFLRLGYALLGIDEIETATSRLGEALSASVVSY